MKYVLMVVVSAALVIGWAGCNANVETTEDATRVEAEGPRIERGDQPLDLDPRTDGDLDVDTPAPGDG